MAYGLPARRGQLNNEKGVTKTHIEYTLDASHAILPVVENLDIQFTRQHAFYRQIYGLRHGTNPLLLFPRRRLDHSTLAKHVCQLFAIPASRPYRHECRCLFFDQLEMVLL